MFLYSSYPSIAYGIIFTVSFWAWFLFEMWVYSRDRGKDRPRSAGGGGRVFIAVVLAITLAVNLPRLAPAWDIRSYFVPIFVVGIVLIWAGLLFRFWSVQTLGRLFSTKLVIQQGHQLITQGPYKYLRNPSYTGALVTFAGIGLGTGNWLSFAVMLLMALIVYALRIRVEDRMLSQAFGQEYADYRQRTWALIPFIW